MLELIKQCLAKPGQFFKGFLPSAQPQTLSENFNFTINPSAEQIAQTKLIIDAYIKTIDANRQRRVGAYPYYLFHEAGQPIRGTVMIFHGFSAKPDQMWRLADYLFRNGFNVYQPSLAGHVFVPPSKFCNSS